MHTAQKGVCLYSVCMDNRSGQIAALRRYISLLELEDKRLSWLKSSQSVSERDRTDANSNWRLNTEKITRAEMELKTLEVRRLS